MNKKACRISNLKTNVSIKEQKKADESDEIKLEEVKHTQPLQ